MKFIERSFGKTSNGNFQPLPKKHRLSSESA